MKLCHQIFLNRLVKNKYFLGHIIKSVVFLMKKTYILFACMESYHTVLLALSYFRYFFFVDRWISSSHSFGLKTYDPQATTSSYADTIFIISTQISSHDKGPATGGISKDDFNSNVYKPCLVSRLLNIISFMQDIMMALKTNWHQLWRSLLQFLPMHWVI